MELIGMILPMAPATTNIHEQRAVSANRTRCSMHMVPLICSFILQHGNMDPEITNFHICSQTIGTQGPKKSQETVCLCSQADGNTPRGELDVMFRQRCTEETRLLGWSQNCAKICFLEEIDSLKSYPHLFGCQGFVHIYLHLYLHQLQGCHIEE